MYSVWKMGAWSVWGLHCDQLGLDRKLLPCLAILATQPWAPTPHGVVQAIITYTLFTMGDKGIVCEGYKETKGCTPQKKVAMHQHAEMWFEALTKNAQNMHWNLKGVNMSTTNPEPQKGSMASNIPFDSNFLQIERNDFQRWNSLNP